MLIKLPLLCLLILIMAPEKCAPEIYGFTGNFGYESQMNVTGSGFGTMRRNDTDDLGRLKWNSTAYGGAVVNHNDLYIGGKGSVNKFVEGSLKPSDGLIPKLVADNTSRTKYDSRFLYGDSAKEFARAHGATVNSVHGHPTLSSLSAVILMGSFAKSILV